MPNSEPNSESLAASPQPALVKNGDPGKPPPFAPATKPKLRGRRSASQASSSDDESDFEERRQRLDVFNQHWMNSCLNETVLPGSPWHKIMAKVIPIFVNNLKGQFGKEPARKEAIFQLLGQNFAERFFSDEKREVTALMDLNEGDRRQMVREAADWLNTQWTKATETANCQRVPPSEDVDPKTSPEMAEFLTHVYRIFYVGLDRNMYIAQTRTKKDKGDKANRHRRGPPPARTVPKLLAGRDLYKSGNNNNCGDSTARSTVPSEAANATARAIMNNESVQLGGEEENLGANNVETEAAMDVAIERYQKNVALPAHAAMPPLSSESSDQIGQGVVTLLERDPRRFADVVCKLHGRQLPKTLRIYLWLETLLRKEREKTKQLQAERILRENFGRAIARGISELNLKKATTSPIESIIENALTETYKRSPGLHASFNDSHLREAAEALNALYVSDRSYEVHMIFWLYPLQLAFEDASHQPEHPLDLALYLHLFRRDVFPGWDESRKIAESIAKKLLELDVDLGNHLEEICRRHQAFKQQPDKKLDAIEGIDGSRPAPSFVHDENLKTLEPFITLLYSWISEGFVGVLDGHGVMFAWDQLMMFAWNKRVIENITISILMLLRHRLLEAFDFDSLQEILVQEPNILYTVDLQATFVFIEHNDNIVEASGLNRQKIQIDELFSGPSGSLSARDRGHLTNLEAILPKFGLRDLEIQLIIPNHCLKKYEWLYDLDVTKFNVALSVYFGAIHMGNFRNAKPPFARDSATNSAGDVVHVIRFLDEFVGGPYSPKNFIDKARDIELLNRSGGLPNVFMALVYNGDFPLKSDSTQGALFGWTQIGAWMPSEGNKAWLVPNDVKWYSLQTAKLALALAPLAALSDTNILIDNEYASHFSHLTVEIFNPTTVPVEAQLFDKIVTKEKGYSAAAGYKDVPTDFTEELPTLDFEAVRQVIPPLPRSEGWMPCQIIPPNEDSLPDMSQTFDFYVDSARFLPDNATITMAHLSFANSGSVVTPENVLFLSHLESSAKSPYYNGRVVINDKKKIPVKDMVAILTIITVDKTSFKPFVLGAAVFPLFKEGKKNRIVLRTGGHQIRLIESFAPTPDRRLNTIPPDVLANFKKKPAIPAVSLLIRVLPHEEKFADVPLYSSGYYQNEGSFEVTAFENALMTVWLEEDRMSAESSGSDHPPTVRDACNYLISQRREKLSDTSPSGYAKWMQQRCLRNGNFPDQLLSPADYIQYSEMAGISVKFGHVSILREDGLPAPARLLFCHCQVYPPKTSFVVSGTKNQIFALEIDLDSTSNQQSWRDPVQTLYPLMNKSAVLLFTVYRLKTDYIVPTGRNERDMLRPGALRSLTENQTHTPPGTDDLVSVGWAVLPIFKNNSVFEQLKLSLNLVEGAPPSDPDMVMPTFVKNSNNASSSKLEVAIADGRRIDGLDLSYPSKTGGTTVRSILSQHIAKLMTADQQGPPDAERVKWHVDCCIRKVTSIVLSTLQP